MSEAMQIQLIETQMQKQTASISASEHFTEQDQKCMEFLFNAEYEIILQSFQFKHAPYLEKKLVEKSKIQQNEEIQRKYELLSQRNHKKLSPQYSQADHLLNRLEFQWQQKKTHYFHRYYFQKYIDNEIKPYVESLEKILMNQQKLIKSDLHILYALDRAIKARESCLNEVRRMLTGLTGADIEDYLSVCAERVYYYQSRKQKLQYKIYGYKINKVLDTKVSRKVFQATKFQQFGQLLNHYRKLTLHVIELITKWKSYIYSLTFDRQKQKQPVEYFYQSENYLLKLINDNSLVSKSFLADYFSFSAKNDTFLLMPLLKLEKDEREVEERLRKDNIDADQKRKRLKYLKKVLAPDTQTELKQMLEKIRILTNEYQANIKKRKTFDLRTIHKINNLDYEKSSKNLSKSQVKLQFSRNNNNMTKSTVSSIRSGSLKLSTLSSEKAIKTVQFGQHSASRRENISFLRKKTLLKLTDPQNKETIISKRQNITNTPNPQIPQNFLQSRQKIGLKKVQSTRQLQTLKAQIKQKIKSQMNLHIYSSGRKLLDKPQFAEFVDLQVKKMMNQSTQISQINYLTTKLARNPQITKEDLNLPVFVETYSIEESELASHLKILFQQQTFLEYEFMQLSREELINGRDEHVDKHDLLENLPCLYFLKVKQKINKNLGLKENLISSIMFTTKYMQHETLSHRKHSKISRTIEILYMTIKSHSSSVLEKAILKTVEFLFKYQTATSVMFRFYYDERIEKQRQKVASLKQILEKSNCFISEKYIYRTNKKANQIQPGLNGDFKKKITQAKFLFSKQIFLKTNNVNDITSRADSLLSNSFSLKLGLYGLFSAQNLQLINDSNNSENKQILSELNYDYLLTEILKNHIDSDSFRTIGNRQLWSHRLRVIIQNIFALKQKESCQQVVPYLQIESFSNIQDLNKSQKLTQKAFWQNIKDVTQSNSIKMISLQLVLSLPYICRAFINSQGKKYLRFQIKEQIEVLNMQYRTCVKLKDQMQEIYEQKIFLFDCLGKKNLRIGLFDATKICDFLKKENTKIELGGKNQALLTISDLINSLSFIKSQNYGRAMKLLYKETPFVGNMYIPMFHSSSAPSSQTFNTNQIHPIQCKDLQSISNNNTSNQFVLGDDIAWKYDVYLENGIRYNPQKEKNVVLFQSDKGGKQLAQKRMGIVVFLIPEFIVMYSKIV